MKLPKPPAPPDEFQVTIQGKHKGSSCRVVVYRLVDHRDGLTFRQAQAWSRFYRDGTQLGRSLCEESPQQPSV